MSFKENLKERLSFSGMYVKELAALSGVKKQTIDSYLNINNCMPSAAAAVAIARVLGVSVEYLVTGEKINENNSPCPAESVIIADITAKMSEKNRKMAVEIVRAMKKQEEKEIKTHANRAKIF